MPTIVRRGVSLSEAWQEGVASAPIKRVMLYAYELWHPTLTEPIRFVNDLADLVATLESTAPRDASTAVTFLACPLEMNRPEESDTAESPSVSLTRPDVAGLLKAARDNARGSTDPWTIIERVYASDVLSAPAQLPPQSFEITMSDLSGGTAQITASYDDEVSESVPRLTFKREEYPGLKR